MNSLLYSLVLSLALTLMVEVVAALLLGLRGTDLLLVGLINCLTNPLVNYGYAWLSWSFPNNNAIPILGLAAMEMAVVLAEGLLFHFTLRYRQIHPFLLSLILNTASFAVGELIVFMRMLTQGH